MKFRMFSSLLGLAILAACSDGNKQAQMPPPEVQVYQTKGESIPVYQEFVGQVYGLMDIDIRARVEGFLEGIHFREGSTVKRRKLLYTIESQPFEADVAAKMSGVAEAKTAHAKAESDLNRIRPLAEQKAVSQSDLDAAVAIYEASIAAVDAAEANLRASRIQLGYTKVYSPITGIIGKTQAKVGDFVGREPNPVILNTVSRTDTILVQFFITENQYLQFARYHAENPEAAKGKRDDNGAALRLILADGSEYENPGEVDFIDRNIDPTTGALLVQASFPNPQGLLRPGQFGRIRAKLNVIENGVMIPQRCVTELQGLFSVNVVNDENKVERREITVGSRVSDFWVITSGLSVGEKVIYEGLQKVRQGIEVNATLADVKPVNRQQ